MDTKLAPQSSRQKTPEAPARPAPHWPYDGPMTWQDVVDHPSLHDLPFRIELDPWGRVIMSPINPGHSRMQAAILRLLEEYRGGKTFVECSIDTALGIRSADVAWASNAFVEEHGYPPKYANAPEICVEVRPPSNPDAEMAEKVMLYLAKGAQEVWICDLEGNVTFHRHAGPMERSALAPDFPARIDL